MKTRLILHILMLISIIFLAACVKEGPAGLSGLDGQNGQDGSDGSDGSDGVISCTICHEGTQISSKKFQYSTSGHNEGLFVAYAGGKARCAECHSSEGFLEYQYKGSVDSDILSPSAFSCKTCHPLHTTFEYTDFGLRTDAPVAMKFNKGSTVLDLGDESNLCVNCHQTRTAEPNSASPGATFSIESIHYGPHHGPQANLFEGIGFAEIDGPIVYPAPGLSLHRTQASCISCHMAEFSANTGGHTFKPSLAKCNSCHTFTATTFNYFGKQTDIQLQLDDLRDQLLSLGVIEWIEADQTYEPVVGTYPMVQAQAYFNWIGLTEDRSLGVHNPVYTRALLTNSIAALKLFN